MSDLTTHPLRTDMLLAMRRLARSVTVISSAHDGRRYSMSATAVDSLSTDPPSLLICINRSGRLKGEARFTTGDWHTSAHGVPYLRDAQANLVCEQDGRFEYGTHTVFIGRIREVLMSGDVDPLVYLDGAYTTPGAPLARAAA